MQAGYPQGILNFEGVRGRHSVAAIAAALEEAGATILTAPDPTVAPYVFVVRTPGDKRVEIVCYAFTAREYRRSGRATGEHRVRVGYGRDTSERAHDVYVDPTGRRSTLMFGVHHALGVFVAVDPRMHSPMWFGTSIPVSEDHLLRARAVGWSVWERERSEARRRRVRPEENLQTESVLAFLPRHFLRYVAFERLASGLDTGERTLLAERLLGRGLGDRLVRGTAEGFAGSRQGGLE